MSENSKGRATVIAGLLISLGIVVGAFLVSSALDRATNRIELVASALEGTAPVADRDADSDKRRARPANDEKGAERYDVEIGDAPVLGDDDAPVTIVEWSDFQCPFCGRALPTVKQIEREYGDSVRVVFKHMPLSIHPNAPAAHAAAEAAHRQGKFWEMHDRIFAAQRDLEPDTFERYAQELGLDMDRFRRDVESDAVDQRIEADKREARSLGVTGTPSFFINGRFVQGAQPFERFKRVIDAELEEQS